MSLLSELKVDPLNYVAGLDSPIGVYIRREVFRKEAKSDFNLKKRLYDKTVSDQYADGSWDQLFVRTANNLWNLALLGYKADDGSVSRALAWLLSNQKYEYRGYPGFFNSPNRKDASLMRSTLYGEFGPGCSIFYDTTYAVHLFHLFNLDDKKEIQATVRSYLQFWNPEWCGTWCTINVLRMLIEHPLSAKSKQVENGMGYLAKLQSKTGAWKGLPFFHTFHALSRCSHDKAKKQFEKASALVVRRQNEEGSWGKKERELSTFLVLDALRNADSD